MPEGHDVKRARRETPISILAKSRVKTEVQIQELAPPTKNSSAVIVIGGNSISFGANPHNEDDVRGIRNFIGADVHTAGAMGVIVDCREAGEKLITEKTPYQYNENMKKYIHPFEIKDRKCPSNQNSLLQFLKSIVHFSRLYVHCRGGHGRAGMVVACLLRLHGLTSEEALREVYSAHQERTHMEARFRTMGSPQTKVQKHFVHSFLCEDNVVKFYDPKGPNGYLSNLFICKKGFVFKGIRFDSVEKCFQWAKFNLPENGLTSYNPEVQEANKEYLAYLLLASTGAKVFQMGRVRKYSGFKEWRLTSEKASPIINNIVEKYRDKIRVREDWDDYRNIIMEQAVMAKFEQNLDLKQKLMNLQGYKIQEASPRDWYWGIGADGKGNNRLGEILMKLCADFVVQQRPGTTEAV